MKLNKTDRDKLRKDLDKLLDKVKFDPENRIHILDWFHRYMI